MLLHVSKNDLDQYVFDDNGLDFKEGISKESLASWLDAQINMLSNLGDELVEPGTMKLDDDQLGFIPFALGDLANFLQCLKEKGLK